MSDIDVTSGGAIAVDTASLRHAATGLDAVADDLAALRSDAARLVDLLEAGSTQAVDAPVERARGVAHDLGRATGEALGVAQSLREAADVYEIVELTNERDLARAAGDEARGARASAQLAAARAAHPAAALRADTAVAAWRLHTAANAAADVMSPLAGLSPVLALELGILAPFAIAGAGGGLIPRGASLAGARQAVTVTAVGAPMRAASAPGSLQEMVERIPDGAGHDAAARVRVERYAMPDGSQQFAVYVAGTQDWALGGRDAFDMVSNVQLYAGLDSASAEAAQQALVAAGAQPGDALTVAGFSQGAMVAAWLAQDSPYEVRGAVLLGSPVAVDLPPGVPLLSVEHGDDLVAALQGSHDAGILGSTDSVIVTRDVDPLPGGQDILDPAHRLDRYASTTGMFERSGDPRVAAFQELVAGLGTASSVTSTEYAAVRP